MKQNNEIRFKCTTDEHDRIKEKASACGMTIKQYLLYLGIKSKIRIEVE